MDLKKLKFKIFQKKKKFKKEGGEIDPNTYWKMVVLAFFILSGFAFSFGLYFSNNLEKDFSVTQNSSISFDTNNKERLSKVLEYFSQRENKSKEIINSPSPVIDPSL